MKKIILIAVCIAAGLLATFANAEAYMMYADEVLGISQGSADGNFPGSYVGGAYPGSFPVALTEDQAKAAVLGAPDGKFLSLPGDEATYPTPSGTGFKWATVTVAFATTFSFDDDIVITELGNNYESAYLFVWSTNGGNFQMEVTRGVSDNIVVDLSTREILAPYLGNTFDKITIGGQDLAGASYGFDLDAIGINRVPEPGSLLLFGAGLAGIAGLRKRFKR